jgi:hypothetical protein
VHFLSRKENAILSNLAVRCGRKRLSPDAARREARHRAWTCSRTPHASSRCAARAQPRSLCSARRAVSAANVPSWCRLHRLGASEAAALAVNPPRATQSRAARNNALGRRARAPRASGAAASGPRDRPRDACRRVVCRRLVFSSGVMKHSTSKRSFRCLRGLTVCEPDVVLVRPKRVRTVHYLRRLRGV